MNNKTLMALSADCRVCQRKLLDGVISSSSGSCGWCEKKYYDALYERQDLINEYLEAKGRL